MNTYIIYINLLFNLHMCACVFIGLPQNKKELKYEKKKKTNNKINK